MVDMKWVSEKIMWRWIQKRKLKENLTQFRSDPFSATNYLVKTSLRHVQRLQRRRNPWRPSPENSSSVLHAMGPQSSPFHRIRRRSRIRSLDGSVSAPFRGYISLIGVVIIRNPLIRVPFFFSNPNDCSMYFPPFAELETKRILLDIFKEKQKKSAEAGTIPSFYKKAREIKHRFIIFNFLVFFMHELLALSSIITFLYFITDGGLMKTSLCFNFLRTGTFTVAFAFFLTVFPYEYACCNYKSNNTQID